MEQFSVGIDVIDQQHLKLIEYINQLDDMRSRGSSRNEVERLINALVDHAIHHFNFEEKMQEEAGYPYIKAHRRLHAQFARRLADFQTRYARGEDISGELGSFLTSWFPDHLRYDDFDYVESARAYLREHPDFAAEKKGIFAHLFG